MVLSQGLYNEKVKLTIFCPVTNQIKDYPFEVIMPDGLPVSGVILADQIKSLDWRVRDAEWICTSPHRVVAEVLQKLGTLLS
ncbi:MAG: type II toxin-antitoxin system PemK/MazF family toxin [Candidatus Brocadia sp.]|nr:type II toxin-antitoxin system PemK/MazF family toxin [Candidatus Brocadia sp.]